MLFDKSFVEKAVKQSLEAADRTKKNAINIALSTCLDDLSLRIKSYTHLTKTNIAVNSSAREVDISGENFDFDRLYALSMVVGTDQAVLQWVDQDQFVRDHEDPNATANLPGYFTIFESEDGYPTIRFDRPLSGAGTLTVYYYSQITSESIQKLSNVAPVIQGTVAYFYGVGSSKGSRYYANYEKLVALMRGHDKFVEKAADGHFALNKQDADFRKQFRTFSRRRR